MRIAGTPRFLWRQALGQLGRYVRTRDPRTSALDALKEELRLLQYWGLIVGCWRLRQPSQRPALSTDRAPRVV
jgi:hypothetical protein